MAAFILQKNIAAGQSAPEYAMNSWMNSEGHRANILSTTAKTIGIGCIYHNGTYYWVQCFGSGDDASSCDMPDDYDCAFTVKHAVGSFSEATSSSGIIFSSLATYEIKPYIYASSNKITLGEKAKLQIYIKNAGYEQVKAKINNNCAEWSSSTDSFSVNGTAVTAEKAGTSVISAAMENFTATVQLSAVNKTQPQETTSETGTNNTPAPDVPGTTSEDYEPESPVYTEPDDSYEIDTVKNNKPSPSKIVKLTRKKKAFEAKWKKIKGVSGYQLQYSTNKKFSKKTTVKINNSKTTKKNVKKLKSKKTYYVRIRTFKTVNGKKYYSSWSKTCKVKTK